MSGSSENSRSALFGVITFVSGNTIAWWLSVILDRSPAALPIVFSLAWFVGLALWQPWLRNLLVPHLPRSYQSWAVVIFTVSIAGHIHGLAGRLIASSLGSQAQVEAEPNEVVSRFHRDTNLAASSFDIDDSPPTSPIELGYCKEDVSRCLKVSFLGLAGPESEFAEFSISGMWGDLVLIDSDIEFGLRLKLGCFLTLPLGNPLGIGSFMLGDFWIEQRFLAGKLSDRKPASFDAVVLEENRERTRVGLRIYDDPSSESEGRPESNCVFRLRR